ncbi:Acid sphingomyelinase-like phosphodiesterase 3b [Mactra antiquata]
MREKMDKVWMKLIVSIFVISSAGADTGYFWHITDFHWDFSYWTDQLSCNGMNITQPGMFGNQWCDSPFELVQATVQGISDVKNDVDFILWTGDSVPHMSPASLSKDRNKELVRNITNLMKDNFTEQVPVYATFGNHDYYPRDQYPPHGDPLYNATYDIWKSWISNSADNITDAQSKTFLKGGYYTVLARPGLRIIAMNSNLYYTKDLQSQNFDDPADQFSWLDNVLTEAKRNNEKTILTGHVPPGYTTPRAVRWMTKKFNHKFVDIVQRHADVIVAMHFGHEHHDNFRLFYDSTGSPVVSLFIAPSVTPWRYQLPTGEKEPPHNPGARLVAYDRQTGKQLDIYQYYLDLNKANTDKFAKWLLGYNATSLYGINDVTAASMGALVNKMTSSQESHFMSYVKWYNTNADARSYPCDDTCYEIVMCGLKNLEEDAFSKCLPSKPINGTSSLYINIFIIVFTCLLSLLMISLS